MVRRRIYEPNRDESLAVGLVETFNDRPWEYRQDMHHPWPEELQQVGESLAIAYSSDKWKDKDRDGRRKRELYKHLAESKNVAFVKSGLLVDFEDDRRGWPVIGPMMSFEDVPFPDAHAILGLFEEIDLHLYTEGTDRSPRFAKDDDEGVVKVTVRHGIVGASKIRWSDLDPGVPDEPFLFVSTQSQGVLILVFGEHLAVEKDGITG